MTLLERAFARIDAWCEAITVILMLAIMSIVFSDVVLRYIFNSPIPWAFDLISLYLMAGVFFLSLSRTYAKHGHVGVDILLHRMSPVGRRLSEILTCVVAIPLFGLMAKVGVERAYDNWVNGDVMSGLVAWPMWISSALVPVGAGLLVLRLFYRLVGHVASLATGRDVIPMMPLAGHQTAK